MEGKSFITAGRNFCTNESLLEDIFFLGEEANDFTEKKNPLFLFCFDFYSVSL